jgi:hypothetical protein
MDRRPRRYRCRNVWTSSAIVTAVANEDRYSWKRSAAAVSKPNAQFRNHRRTRRCLAAETVRERRQAASRGFVESLRRATVNTFAYRQAFERIRAEFSEMPGMRLTPEQVERLSGVDRVVCKSVLDDLVRAKFLDCLNGSYGRRSDTSRAESSEPRRDWKPATASRTRRAS